MSARLWPANGGCRCISNSTRAGGHSRHLLDFGFTPEVLLRNFALLDLDPARLDGLILSHGHRDHYGGLEGFVAQHRAAMPSDIKLVTGGESAFREKWIKRRGADPVSWGILDRGAIEAAHVATLCCDMPEALAGPFTTGHIPRQSFERILGSTLVEPAAAPAHDHFTEAERLGRLVPDQHPDEHATCYILQGRGLVVISSCGHVGLINSIKAAMAVSGVGKLHAVIGGFHLGPAPMDYVEHTVGELKGLNPDVVIPMHCSGAKFIQTMQREMPDRLVATNIGSPLHLRGLAGLWIKPGGGCGRARRSRTAIRRPGSGRGRRCGVAHRARADHDLCDAGLSQRRDRGAVSDPADAGPDDRGHAHRAGLAGAVENAVRPAAVAVTGDIVVDRRDLAMEDRVDSAIVDALGQNRAVGGADDDGAERISRVGLRLGDREPHRRLVRLRGMAPRSSGGDADAGVPDKGAAHAAAPANAPNTRLDSIAIRPSA